MNSTSTPQVPVVAELVVVPYGPATYLPGIPAAI